MQNQASILSLRSRTDERCVHRTTSCFRSNSDINVFGSRDEQVTEEMDEADAEQRQSQEVGNASVELTTCEDDYQASRAFEGGAEMEDSGWRVSGKGAILDSLTLS
ncbi:hypothetical protein BD626DRAFT_618 [Schizophyllum amplum]|uniref:Uncharacterized protein n=1 Tax=Schizophyllum amplum TaxID=97359 RepID=A0A550CVJ9_9AGAR|nr:hypothetical protein BD626DRAFT_618 [Auriculariopsis ampla]